MSLYSERDNKMNDVFTKLDYYFPNWKVVSVISLVVATLCVLGGIGTYEAVQNNKPTGTPTVTQTPYVIVNQPITEVVQQVTNVVSFENNYTERQIVVPQDRVVFSDKLVLATVPIPMTVIVQQWSIIEVPVTVVVSLCHSSYSVCLPVVDDLNCGDIPFYNFLVFGEDEYNLDADNDGIACEEDDVILVVATDTPTNTPTNTATSTLTSTPTDTPVPPTSTATMPTSTVPPTATPTITVTGFSSP